MLTAILLAATLSSFDEVVAAERAFAAASLEKGLHESFLAYLAEDAIVFALRRVNGIDARMPSNFLLADYSSTSEVTDLVNALRLPRCRHSHHAVYASWFKNPCSLASAATRALRKSVVVIRYLSHSPSMKRTNS